MNKNTYLLLLMLIFAYGVIQAQSPCFNSLFEKGKDFLAKEEYQKAFEHFLVSRNCWDKEPNDPRDSLDYFIDLTSDQWTKALNDARRRALRQKNLAEQKKEEALVAQKKADLEAKINYAYFHTYLSQEALKNMQPEKALREAYDAYKKIDSLNIYSSKKDSARKFVFQAFGNAVFAHQKKEIDTRQTKIKGLVQAPNGTRFATFSRDSIGIKIWRSDGALLDSIGAVPFITHLSFSSNGQQILIGLKNGKAYIYKDSVSGLVELSGHTNAVVQGSFLDDQNLMTISRDGTGRIWDKGGKQIRELSIGSAPLLEFKLSRDKKKALFRSAYSVSLWNLQKGELLLGPLTHDQLYIYSMAFSPDESTILTTSADGSARLWDHSSSKKLNYQSEVLVGGFSSELQGSKLLLGTKTGQVWQADLQGQGHNLPYRHAGYVKGVKFSSDGKHQLSVGADHSIYFSGKESLLGQHGKRINTVELSANDQYVLSSSDDGTAKLWSIKGDLLMNMPMGDAGVTQALFFDQAKKIAALTNDGKLYISPTPTEVLKALDSGSMEFKKK